MIASYLKKTLLILMILSICGFGVYQVPVVNRVIDVFLLNFGEVTVFKVDGNTLTMSEIINSKTPAQLENIFSEHPNIDTIVLGIVPGSVDDANLQAASWIAQKGLTMKLSRYSYIASGGTDFFLAGKRRIIEDGAMVGVHAWGYGAGTSAQDFPRGHEYHQPYIEYYQKVGFSREDAEAFYYFTIDMATAEDIHIMTNEELLRYNISTEEIAEPAVIYLEWEERRKREGMDSISA